MRIALVTTTINIPHVLTHYRKLGPDIAFFVAGDLQTPPESALGSNAPHFMSAKYQKALGYACSELIGWKNIQRRNIAILEAVKWGADIIITIDDDNIPLDPLYFERFRNLFETPWTGIQVASESNWFDPGSLLMPAVRHRGISPVVPRTPPQLASIVNVDIGVAAGLWVGDGDVNAYDRLANPPDIHAASELAQQGVAVQPHTATVWNAQNVAFRRELAPCMFQAPGIGRADDIFASLITQRIMRERGMRVHFGKPFTACWQDRSTKSIVQDMREEMFLLEHVEEFELYLSGFNFDSDTHSVIDQTREIYLDLRSCAWWPKRASDAALAFCDDLEKVL